MSEYALEMLGVTKTFSKVTALDHVNLRVKKGEIHALIGENGAGKTTLMKIIVGLIKPSEGNIQLFNGLNPNIARKKIGCIIERPCLFEDFSAYENLKLFKDSFGIKNNGIEEILELPAIDFEKGRIQEVLKACRILYEKGEHVVFEVSGPLTILNVLIDPKYVFKGMRKKPELMARIFAKLGKEILAYMKLAKEQGADFISYADSSGGVNILGPKMAEQMVNLFTYDFVKQAGKLADEHTMILLCPKTTFALLGTGKAKLMDCQIHDDRSQEEDSLSYAEACIRMKGKIRFAGQMCIKNLDYRMKNGIMKEVHIL